MRQLIEHWTLDGKKIPNIDAFKRELPDEEHDRICDASPGDEVATVRGLVRREADTCSECSGDCDVHGYCSCSPKCRSCDNVASRWHDRFGIARVCAECDEAAREYADDLRADEDRERRLLGD